MTALYQESFVEELRAGAAGLVQEWGLSPRTEVTLLNLSENATFRADDPEAAAPVILRVHRPDYHSRAEIESELAWIESLIAENVVATPPPLATRSGGHIAQFGHRGQVRHVVAFAFMTGRRARTGCRPGGRLLPARRDQRAPAPPCPAVAAPARLRPQGLDLRHHRRAGAALGRLARRRRPARRRPEPAGAGLPGAAAPPGGLRHRPRPLRPGPMPTCGSPTCWWRATGWA